MTRFKGVLLRHLGIIFGIQQPSFDWLSGREASQRLVGVFPRAEAIMKWFIVQAILVITTGFVYAQTVPVPVYPGDTQPMNLTGHAYAHVIPVPADSGYTEPTMIWTPDGAILMTPPLYPGGRWAAYGPHTELDRRPGTSFWLRIKERLHSALGRR